MTALAPTRPELTEADLAREPAEARPVARPGHGKSASTRRSDVQGLRALAVVAVVGDHLLGRPSGGFIGVDVFFVISGFLITGLLLREHQRHGRIDLIDFYRRRIKRTVPVAWVVLLVTLGIGSVVLSVYGFGQLLPAAFSAGTFWSNWHLVAIGTDYLHATDAPSAVQHYWSLAVEEQFYLVWPAVLIGLLAARRRLRAPWLPPLVISLLLLVSVAWAALETATHPTAAYFSTFTRGWELLAGALLACATPVLGRIPSSWRPWLAWAGLALLVWGLLTIGPDSPFPYPWALVAVLGTVLVIGAGTGAEDTHVWPLTNGAAQYIGKISYSIYLWHFPVIVFVGALHPEAGLQVHLLELGLTVLLSMLSYRFIEEPFRSTSWRRPVLRRPSRRLLAVLAVGTAACVVLSGAAVATRERDQPASAPTAPYFDETSSLVSARSAAIDSALATTTWPRLTPDDQALGEGARVREWTVDGCLNGFGPEETARRCVYGDRSADRTVVLYGDSVALSYLPGIRRALEGRGWRIEVLTDGQCPAIDITVALGDGSPYPDCDAYHRFALDRIAAERPALVIASSSYLSLDRLGSGARDAAAGAEWSSRTAATVDRLADAAQHVLILDAPPIESSPQSCKTAITTPQDCVTGVPGDWKLAADAQHDGVRAAKRQNVAYPSTLPWFCAREGRCPSFVAGVVTLADGMHLTTAGSQQLAPLLREAIDRAAAR